MVLLSRTTRKGKESRRLSPSLRQVKPVSFRSEKALANLPARDRHSRGDSEHPHTRVGRQRGGRSPRSVDFLWLSLHGILGSARYSGSDVRLEISHVNGAMFRELVGKSGQSAPNHRE